VPVNGPTGVKLTVAVLPVVAPDFTVRLVVVPVTAAVKPVTARLLAAEVEGE
jgi:hypothetical protein